MGKRRDKQALIGHLRAIGDPIAQEAADELERLREGLRGEVRIARQEAYDAEVTTGYHHDAPAMHRRADRLHLLLNGADQ